MKILSIYFTLFMASIPAFANDGATQMSDISAIETEAVSQSAEPLQVAYENAIESWKQRVLWCEAREPKGKVGACIQNY